MEIFKKVSNIIKNKLIGELIYSKTHQKVEKNNNKKTKTNKHANTKEDFQCLYAPIILTDSIYRKD